MLFRIASISSLVAMCAVRATFFTPQFPAGTTLCCASYTLGDVDSLCRGQKSKAKNHRFDGSLGFD